MVKKGGDKQYGLNYLKYQIKPITDLKKNQIVISYFHTKTHVSRQTDTDKDDKRFYKNHFSIMPILVRNTKRSTEITMPSIS